MKLTERHKVFCDIYIETLNATESAKRAKYSSKTAYSIGQQLLKKIEIKSYIEEQLEKLKSERIASATEVLENLTAIIRNQTTEDVVVVVGTGDGCSSPETVTKTISERDRLKALELLGRRYSLFTDKVDISGELVIFNGEDKLED